jgi:hypothetical protein
VTRTWTRTDGDDRSVTWTADGARVVVQPDPDRPGEWLMEAYEGTNRDGTLSYLGSERAQTRAGVMPAARRWFKALTIPAE